MISLCNNVYVTSIDGTHGIHNTVSNEKLLINYCFDMSS